MTVKPARISRGAIIGGQFRLERLLGQGGMSAVWAARDLRVGNSVAVKLLGPEAMAKPLLRRRFAREARVTRMIRSPHVAQVIADGVTSGGVPFVVMELLEGESLGAHLAHVGRCSLVTAGSIIEQVCRALSSAHVVGLVHRDVKPANIFLTQQPSGELFVRLLDFGIAKELLFGASGLTQPDEVLGTGAYMSPEQFCSPDSVKPAADLWSLGVVLYEMLTGKRPFDESTFPLLALRIAEGTFLPPSQVCPDLPPEVDDVIARALAPHPSQRYATAAELGGAFLRIVRAHSSDSVIRPDVMRVLYAFSERTQAEAEADEYPEEQATFDAVDANQSSLRERVSGVLLVVLSIAIVLTSWLASGRLDTEQPESWRASPATRASATEAWPATHSQPSAADPTQAISEPMAADSTAVAVLPPTASDAQPTLEAAPGLPPLTADVTAPTEVVSRDVPRATPTPVTETSIEAASQLPPAQPTEAPSLPPAAQPTDVPSLPSAARPKAPPTAAAARPAVAQPSATTWRPPPSPPSAAAPSTKESKYGF